jgi:hypothetical protein
MEKNESGNIIADKRIVPSVVSAPKLKYPGASVVSITWH